MSAAAFFSYRGNRPMKKSLACELDRLDAEVAAGEGSAVATVDAAGFAVSPDGSRYRPTRDAADGMRLISKHVQRLSKIAHQWIAVGSNGRAEVGATPLIAACRVAVARLVQRRKAS